MPSKPILIIAGEPSGDLHAANLVKDLVKLDPSLRFYGLGGRLSREAGVEVVFDIAKLAIVGIVEVVKNIFTIGKVYHTILSRIDADRPALAVLIDYPGFNLNLAKELKRRKIPVVYYVSPQLWAWGKERIKIISGCVTKMVVFFDFEKKMYDDAGIPADFVGHPLLDIVLPDATKEETCRRYGLTGSKKIVAILPGSRKMEVSVFLREMVEACAKIRERVATCQFIVAKYPGLDTHFYDVAAKAGMDIKIADGDTYNVLNVADFAVVSSGTATLETAIMGVPMVIIYKTHPITAFLIRRIFMKTQFIGLVNVIAGREVVPELLQEAMTSDNIARAALEILTDPPHMMAVKGALADVCSKLGAPGARERAARSVYSSLP